MANSSEFIESLREDLNQYLNSKPHLSIRAISKISGVNRYFISKILSSGDCEVKSYDFHQVYLLTQFLSEKKSLRETVDSSNDIVKETLGKFYSSDLESKSSFQRNYEIPDHILYDFDYFMILCLAAIETMTYKIFEKIFPSNKIYKIENLIEEGYLKFDGHKISIGIPGEFFCPPRHILVHHIPEILKQYYSIDGAGMKRCASAFYFQGLNLKSWQKVHDLHSKFMTDVSNIMNDESCRGDFPIFSINALDSFLNVVETDYLINSRKKLKK